VSRLWEKGLGEPLAAYHDYVVFVESKALRGRSKAEYLRQVRKLGTRHPERSIMIGCSLMADSYRVHYNVRGSGRDITVQAESSAEARRTVIEMIPGAVVTGVHRVK
jgi:hypothetical protein